VSIDWVPSDDTGTPAPSPVIAAPLEPLREEALNPAQSPSQPPAEGGGYLERYQRLFAGDSVDPQQAILAALDAAIQSPTSEAPRDEAPVATAPIAEAMPATAVVPAAPLAASVPEPIVKAPSAPAAPIADAAAAAAAPASSALPAAIDVAPGSQAPSKLNFEQDVDWSEDVLARAARAAAAAGERARAHQRAQIAAASAVQSRGPASERARADSGTRARSEAPPQAVSSERAARNRGRKARRARFAATPLFLFAFVGSVMVALGVGFVTGFMVGRETPKAAEASLARPLAEPAPVAAEPPAPVASEAQPATRRKGALTSRVEAVVPQSALNAQTLLGTEAASAAAPAASTAKLLRGPFDPKSAGAALSKAAARAGICVPPGDAGGEAVVTITLDPSGVTSSAAVYGARFSGTQAGECIAGLLRDVKVRPFTGDPVTVKKTIQVN
jgi:hypothetical protein